MNSTPKNKRLTRSRDDRFIGGVAAGIANHLNIDPAIVRIGFVISIIFGGIGVLAYLILLAAVPIEGDASEPAPQPDGSKRLWVIGGTIAMGILALVSIGVTGDGFGGWMFGFAQGFWFGVLIWAIAIGGLVWLLREARDPDAVSAPKVQPPAKTPGPASTASTTVAQSPTQNAPEPRAAAGFPKAVGAAMTGEAPTEALAADAPTTVTPRSSGAATSFGKVMTVIAIVFAAGFTALLLAAVSIVSTTVLGAIPMASVVILLGVGLVVAALNNRHQLALWTLGAAVAIAIPMAIVSIADLRIDGDYGEVREKPVVADSIPGDGYQLAAGAMTIDMRKYPFKAGQTVDLPVKSGLGATRVIVPDDVCVSGSVDGKAGMSEVRGIQTSGVAFDRTFGGGPSRAPVLNIDSEMKVGLFLVVDNTTLDDSGSTRSEQNDQWDGTIDKPWLQDKAQDRAIAACDGTGRKPVDPAEPKSAPKGPNSPQAPSSPNGPTAKSAA